MPIRRRTTSRNSSEQAKCTKTAASSPQHEGVSRETCTLTQPRCIQDRVFNVFVERHRGSTTFIIREMIRSEPRLSCKDYRLMIADSTFLINYGHDRVIGMPHVIGCHGDHVIIQVLLADVKTIVFVYANLLSDCARLIPDEARHFRVDLLLHGNVQCLWSPDHSCVILTEPENCMKPDSESKVLVTDVLPSGDDNFDFQPIRDTPFVLYKNKMVAFDPRKRHRATALTIHSYGRLYKVEKWNLADATCEQFVNRSRTGCKNFNLNHCENSDLGNSCYESTDIQVKQCHMDYSRSGRYIIMLCLCSFMDSKFLRMRVVMLDSDTMIAIKISGFQLQKEQSLFDLYVSTMDRTDCEVLIWCYAKDKRVKQIGEVDLPYDISLQALCRKTILRQCCVHHIEKLPIAPRFINQLSFRHLPLAH